MPSQISSRKCHNLAQFLAQTWKKQKNTLKRNSYIFSSKSHPKQPNNKNVLDSVSLYFLHSRKTFSVLFLWKIFIVYNHIDASFLFLLQKDFYITHNHVVAFDIVFFRKILVALTCFFLKLLFVLFIIVFCHYLYREKKL